MEQPISAQAVAFAWAAALGAALGVCYDLLRVLRRRHPRCTVPADAAFCLLSLAALWAYARSAGRGMLRLFAFLGLACGAAVDALTLSPLLIRLFDGFFALLERVFRLICAPLCWCLKKNLAFFQKTLCNGQKMGYNNRQGISPVPNNHAGKENQTP